MYERDIAALTDEQKADNYRRGRCLIFPWCPEGCCTDDKEILRLSHLRAANAPPIYLNIAKGQTGYVSTAKPTPNYEQLRLFSDDYKPFPDLNPGAGQAVAVTTPKYETAFLVYLDEDGEYVIDTNLSAFSVRRTAKPRDILRGLSEGLAAATDRFTVHTVDTIEPSTADKVRQALISRGSV